MYFYIISNSLHVFTIFVNTYLEYPSEYLKNNISMEVSY